MGVLAPGSAHARPSAQPPIDVSGNFPPHVSAENFFEISLLTRIRVGRSDLNQHKFSIRLADNPQCLCYHREESPQHYFIDCFLYSKNFRQIPIVNLQSLSYPVNIFLYFKYCSTSNYLFQKHITIYIRRRSLIRPKWSFDLILEPSNMMMVYISC
jgi:hypothetical protein